MVALWSVCERGGMVDALSSGGSECILVRVQVPPFALFKNVDFFNVLSCFVASFCNAMCNNCAFA